MSSLVTPGTFPVNNLFTDGYKLRERLYGEVASERIAEIQREVHDAIEHHTSPRHLRYLLLKTTNRCNSDCEYCPHAINRVPRETKSSIPHDDLMRIIDEAAELGVDIISISGGEPLLRNDICEIVRAMSTRRIVPLLLTNGLLLDKLWKPLGEAGLRYVTISIDSVDESVYSKQRGASLEQALRGIDAALRLRDAYPETEVHVSSVLTRDNESDFMKLLSYMNDRDIKVQISPYHQRKDDAENYSIVKRAEIEDLTARLIDMKRAGAGIANSMTFLKHLPDFFCSNSIMPRGFVCTAGYVLLSIDTFLNVKPCWSYMFESLGNLRESSLGDIWFGHELERYRDRILACRCEGCWYLCTSEACAMLAGENEPA